MASTTDILDMTCHVSGYVVRANGYCAVAEPGAPGLGEEDRPELAYIIGPIIGPIVDPITTTRARLLRWCGPRCPRCSDTVSVRETCEQCRGTGTYTCRCRECDDEHEADCDCEGPRRRK